MADWSGKYGRLVRIICQTGQNNMSDWSGKYVILIRILE